MQGARTKARENERKQAVYAAMERYGRVLEERMAATLECRRLAQQNAELKGLLNQYMTSRVNEELCVPPSKVLLAQAGLSKY